MIELTLLSGLMLNKTSESKECDLSLLVFFR